LIFFKTARRQFPSDLHVLDEVLSWFNQTHESFIPAKVWSQCQLALAEGFTNAVRHAHKDYSPEVPIEIEITIFPEFLELRIWDRGLPLDLATKLEQMLAKTNDRAEGGRGLIILFKMADNLTYSRTEDDRNCLLFVKRFAEEGEEGVRE
jgi:serine/threonine-protein kinase RsbW